MTLPAEIFRAYDIRGIVGRTLTAAITRDIGRALGAVGRERGAATFAVCRDGRLSGPELSQALIEGLNASGADAIDIAAAGRALDRGWNRLLYTRHFLATLKPKSLAKLERFPGLYDAGKVRAARCFRDFDDVVTAPLHGFRGVDHYWSAASSAPWLERIRVPTLVLNARNDPFLPEQALLAATRKAAPCVVLEFPRTGGHAGFQHRWLASRVLGFLEP